MTYLEAKKALCRKLNIDYTDIANNDLFTLVDIEDFVAQGAMQAYDYEFWDFAEHSKTATLVAGDITAAIQQTDGNFVVYNGATVIGSATGGFPSDKRMKSGVKATARKGLEVISALQVVDFTWKSGTPQRTQNKGAKVTGFTAQQVAEVLPEIVTVNRGADGKGDETLLLNKAEMIPFVVKAVQELLARVEALEATP